MMSIREFQLDFPAPPLPFQKQFAVFSFVVVVISGHERMGAHALLLFLCHGVLHEVMGSSPGWISMPASCSWRKASAVKFSTLYSLARWRMLFSISSSSFFNSPVFRRRRYFCRISRTSGSSGDTRGCSRTCARGGQVLFVAVCFCFTIRLEVLADLLYGALLSLAMAETWTSRFSRSPSASDAISRS